MANMAWDDLRVLLALARKGSIAEAAVALGVSRSTVGRRLDALEAVADVRLVERTVHGVGLTAAGSRLLPIAERMEEEGHAAERVLAGSQFSLSGRLELAMFEVAVPILAPVLAALQSEHPEIELRLRVGDSTLSLERRECDLAIRATSAPGLDLVGRKIAQMPYAVYGVRPLVELSNPPWILWDEARGAEGTWTLARQIGDPLVVAARVDSAQLMLELTRAGLGVALLPVPVARAFPDLEPMGAVPREGMDIDVWVLTHPDLRRAARVTTVMRFIAQRADVWR